MTHPVVAVQSMIANVDVNPDPGALPGTQQLENLINGIAFWALLACVAAVIIGAGAWAFGSRAGHYGAVGNGKTLVAGGIIGGFLIGASAAIVNFFTQLGDGVVG